jgi:ribosomal-protein-serine acetyltransferase
VYRFKLDNHAELRMLELRHAQELYIMISENRPHLRSWLSWVDHVQSLADIQRYIVFTLNQYAQNNGFSAGIWYQDKLVGTIEYTLPIDWNNKATRLTFWVTPAQQGKGIVTRACLAMIEYAFDQLGLNRVEIRFTADNRRARNVAKRLKFVEECTLRSGEWIGGQYKDIVICSLLAKDWPKRKQPHVQLAN